MNTFSLLERHLPVPLGRTLMILILTNEAIFATLSVVKIPPLAQPSLF